MARRRQEPEIISDAELESLLAADSAPEQAAPAAQARPRGQVVQRPDGTQYVVTRSEYTNESPTQLLNQGFQQDPETGSWYQTTGTYNDADLASVGARIITEEDIQARLAEERRAASEQGALDILNQQGILNAPGMNAFVRGAVEQAPYLDEALAGVAGVGTGQGYDEARRVQGVVAQYDRQNAPLERNLGGAAGFAATMATPGGNLTRGSALGAGAVGGVTGALYGSGAAGDSYAERLRGGLIGGGLGAAGGAGVSAGLNYAQRLGGITGRPSVPGQRVPVTGDPQQRAAARMVRTMEPGALAERDRLRGLGLSPSVLDVSGGTTERLVRTAAGPAGPGATLAVDNSVARAANLGPEVMGVTQAISPEARSASQVSEALTTARDELADVQYPAAYETMITVGDDVIRALGDEPGRAALRRARASAVARQNMQRVTEIDQLLSGQGGEVSAGTIDMARRAMLGRGQAMQQRPDTRDIAGGLFQRATVLDNALEAVPELAPARAAFRSASVAAESATSPLSVINTEPRRFAEWVRSLTPEQRQAATVGVRQEILDRLGGTGRPGGTLNTVSNAPYARQNLAALLGDDAAAQYLGSIQARVQQTQRAARVSPNTNGQTFGRGLDEQTFQAAEAIGATVDVGNSVLRGDPMAIGRTIDRIRSRATLSPEERQAIVELGLGSADELERILLLADDARRAGRPVPRAARRLIERASTRLGPQYAREIEAALRPMTARAEEEPAQ